MGAALLSKRRPVTAHADRLTVKLNRHATRRLWLAQTLIESGAAGARGLAGDGQGRVAAQ